MKLDGPVTFVLLCLFWEDTKIYLLAFSYLHGCCLIPDEEELIDVSLVNSTPIYTQWSILEIRSCSVARQALTGL